MKKTKLRIFFCSRSKHNWDGGLIMLAESEKQAIKMFKEQGWTETEPYKIEDLTNTTEIYGGHRILYDDDAR